MKQDRYCDESEAREHGRWALMQALKSAKRGMPRTANGYFEYADGIFSALFILFGTSRPSSYYRVRQVITKRELQDMTNRIVNG